MDEQKIVEFIDYVLTNLKGSEKSEAQLFLDRLFIAYGNKGIMEAGATLEKQIIIDTKTKFCDLLWPKVVLFEMKSRGEKLADHFHQAKTYWDNTYGNRPEYVILCNFDEFWIYNWNLQREPLDKVLLKKLKEQWRSLAFLCPGNVKPLFENNYVEVTEKAADKIAQLYNNLVKRNVDRVKARRFSLQCLVCLFAEDTDLFPNNSFFSVLIDDCRNGQSTYDLFKNLFEQMNSKDEATGGRYKGVRYFNGGIFSQIFPLDLTDDELKILEEASKYDWSKVQPSIFGTIFEDSLGEEERHTTGAHFTLLSEIMSVVEPTILRPWREKIESAKTLRDLNQIHEDLSKFRILDPACGSGNFLYIAYRELRFLEIHLFKKMVAEYPSISPASLHSKIKCDQFYGIDINPLGIELAKITLSMAKKITTEEFNKFTKQNRFYDESEDPLPFDNLDDNFTQGDALFIEWPKVDAIIGNPPYQSKNKMQREFGPEYLAQLHAKFPDMPGRADYCVYWFRKAHDCLPMGGRAGLVGTNTIRETYSRMGGLDYIISNNGVIFDAISSMPWSGSASVHVSIVNWMKTKEKLIGKKKLRELKGENREGSWEEWILDIIPSSLTSKFDVTLAKNLKINVEPKTCFQGQTHGNDGFLLTTQQRKDLLLLEPKAAEVTFPYIIAEELLGDVKSQPSRFVIDFQPRDIYESMTYKNTIKIIEENVLPDRKIAYDEELRRNEKLLTINPKAKVNKHHYNFFNRWWRLSYERADLISKIDTVDRYISCARVTKRPIFEFVSNEIRPNDAVMVFLFNDDFTFGILQSSIHWEWFIARCSTLTERFRYTSETVFNSFPWPQWGIIENNISPDDVDHFTKCIDIAHNVAVAGRDLRELRNRLRRANNCSLRDLYRGLELPGKNPLKDAHERLDKAVNKAYSFGLSRPWKTGDELMSLYTLNFKCAEFEAAGKRIFGPGLPQFCRNQKDFYSTDCITITN